MATEVESPPTVDVEVTQQDQNLAPIDVDLRDNIRKAFLRMKITVCVNLNKNDIAGFNTPQPYYVSLYFHEKGISLLL